MFLHSWFWINPLKGRIQLRVNLLEIDAAIYKKKVSSGGDIGKTL
jgi:hypothetical protein